MNLATTQLKDTYGNLLTIGTSAGSPTTGTIENGDGQDITALDVNGSITTNGLTIDQTSNVVLDLNTTNSNGDITLNNVSYGVRLRTNSAGGFSVMPADTTFLNVALNGDVSFYDSTGSNPSLFWDASTARLGLGTDSPANTLTIKGGAHQLDIETDSSGVSLESIDRTALSDPSDISYYARNGSHKFFNGSYTEAMRIDSDGNVGIGTTPNAFSNQTSLTVRGTSVSRIDLQGAGGSGGGVFLATATETQLGGNFNIPLKIFTSSTAGITFETNSNPRMTIDSSGNVGIGETNPLVPLHISKDSASGENIALVLDNNNTTANNEVGLLFRGSVGGQNTDFQIASINKSANNADLVFRSDGTVERMRIDSSGNVGIGTNSIDSSDGRLKLSAPSGNSNPSSIALYGNNGGAFGGSNVVRSKIDSVTDGTAFGANMRFFTNDTSDVYQERMRINSSGNVGIGCSPSDRLEVKGATAKGALVLSSGDTTIIGNDVIGQINFKDYDSDAHAGGDQNDLVNIKAIALHESGGATALDGSTGEGYALSFSTSKRPSPNALFTVSEAMRIDSSGTTTITATSGSSLQNGTLLLKTTNASNNAGLMFINSGNTSSFNDIAGIASFVESGDAKGNLRFWTRNSDGDNTDVDERMRITSSGNVLVGTTANPLSGQLHSNASDTNFVLYTSGVSWASINNHTNSGTQYFQDFRYDGTQIGSILGSNTSTAFNTTSDYRLKENVVALTGALDRVHQLNPSRFNFIADADTTVDGFLAHEVADVVPEAITGEKDAVDDEGNPIYQGIDQSKLVPLLVGAIQELRAEIEQLKNQ